MGRHAVLLPALRVAAAAAAAPPGSLLSVSREETLLTAPGEAKRAVLGLVRKSRAAAGTRRTTAPAAMPR